MADEKKPVTVKDQSSSPTGSGPDTVETPDGLVAQPRTGVKPSSLPQTAAVDIEHPGLVVVNTHLLADDPEAHTDRVAMVSRDKNGKPDQSSDFEVLVSEDAHDAEKAAALNLPAQG